MPKDIETSTALKDIFNIALLKRISKSISNVYPKFNSKVFLQISTTLQKLEMKPRVQLIRDQLKKTLPDDFPKALDILLSSLDKDNLSGFDVWPYTDFVETFGLNHLQLSLHALQKMTPRFTAEWAIRPFIVKYPNETMDFLLQCSISSNEHVRRWASEGTRPRLPWGFRLQEFVKNPTATYGILENLKFDDSLYVRKSVANHLNDITKDHPDQVIHILKRWKTEANVENDKKVDWIIRRSLRTLIKDGHPKALALLGVSTAVQVKIADLKIKKSKLKLGDRLEFSFLLKSTSGKSQKLVVDYVIHFMKSNGKVAPKVFKLKATDLDAKKSEVVAKSHSLKKITTREYYSGRHYLEIQVNGKILGKVPWDLKT